MSILVAYKRRFCIESRHTDETRLGGLTVSTMHVKRIGTTEGPFASYSIPIILFSCAVCRLWPMSNAGAMMLEWRSTKKETIPMHSSNSQKPSGFVLADAYTIRIVHLRH